MVGFKQVFVDSWLEIKAFQTGVRCHFDQVFETGLILTQQRQVVSRILTAARFIGATTGSDVSFIADDRVDVFGPTSVVELERPVQVAVVRQRQCVHAMVNGSLYQLGNRACSVEQAVVAVAVQVNERAIRHLA